MAGRRVRGADRAVTTPWNMASFRARSYSPRKYRPVAAIGNPRHNTIIEDAACMTCGCLICGCELPLATYVQSAKLSEQFKPIEPLPEDDSIPEWVPKAGPENAIGVRTLTFEPNPELQRTAYDRQLAAESERSQQIVRAVGEEKMIAELVTEWIEDEQVPWSESGKRILDAWSCGCVITLIGRVKPERLAAAVKWRLSRGPLLTPTTFIESVKWAEREGALARRADA